MSSRPRTKSLLIAALMAAVMSSACFSHSYTVGKGAQTHGTPAYSKWESHHIYGLVGGAQVNVDQICPSGNATVQEYTSFWNGLIGGLIGLVYYPTTVEVYCGEASVASTQP